MSRDARQTLLGADFAAVCARFGAPLGCDIVDGVLRLTYLGADGNAIEGAVEFVDGVVTFVARGLRRSPRKSCGHEMVGWPVELVLPRLGRPLRVALLGESQRYEFERYEVTVHEGTVACVVPVPPRVMAPTPRASA